MSAEWTVERLEALPEGTVIEASDDLDDSWQYVKTSGKYPWELIGESQMFTSAAVEFECHDIRVVSVPIEALMAYETVQVAEDAFVDVTHLAGPIRNEAEVVIRAAVAHVTGEAT